MRWTESWDIADLTNILRRNLESAGVPSTPEFWRVKDFKVKSRFSDGRINILEVKTDRGTFELHGDKIRVALKTASGRMLESDRFDITVDGDRVIARGSGYGHGVGMCQMGALSRSAAGQDYREILAAYYPGIVLAVAK
jgi:stage II sporulation protein D